ncbi:phospholipid carrier-dependent glycosyltransferase [Enterobacter kobei]|nr:phospholipid carrier-dependent glycosyltransferase [Enterobacter kobei]
MHTYKHQLQRKKTAALSVLICIIFILYLITLPLSPLWLPDETRFAEISREMLTSGDWLLPRIFDFSHFEKPVAGYWLNSISQWLFGHNNVAARAVSALSTVLTACLVYRMSMAIRRDVNQALTATLVYASTSMVYGTGTYAILDPAFTFWLTLSLYLFWKGLSASGNADVPVWWFTGGLACGIAFLTKGFLAFVIPLIVLVPWCLIFRRMKPLLFALPLILAGAMVAALPWSIMVYRLEPDFWRWFVRVEHIQRFMSGNAQHTSPFWFYLPVIFLGMLPWAGTLPATLKQTWRQAKAIPAVAWIALSVVAPFIFLSLSGGKLLTYVLPCFPPLAVLTAHMLCTPGQHVKHALQNNSRINIIAGLLGVILITGILAPWGVFPLYTGSEIIPMAVAACCFAFWAVAGMVSLKQKRYALLVALCPFAVGLLNNMFIPHAVVYAKQPQPFIENIRNQLQKSEYIVVQNTGLASAVAWEMKRSDIILLGDKEDISRRMFRKTADEGMIHASHFSQWLEDRRLDNDVSLLLYISDESLIDMYKIPVADTIWRQGKFMLLHYIRQSE